MNTLEETAKYLEQILGDKPLLSAFAKSKKGIPLFLEERYVLRLWKWNSKEICLAAYTDTLQRALTPSEISKDSEKLTNTFNMPVVLVFKSITPYQRTRLIQNGVPFLIPNSQLFIPPFMDLTENFNRVKHGLKLSGTAQLIVLYELLKHPTEPITIKKWAETTGRSSAMVSKAYATLIEHEICEKSRMQRNRKGICFTAEKLELWQKTLPFLRSPVTRRIWCQIKNKRELQNCTLIAGLTALAGKTMLSDDPVPTRACTTDILEDLIKNGTIIVCEDPELADIQIECWSYDPKRLSGSDMVDDLSLWLSITDSNDERIEQAREELLRNFKW